MQLAHPLNPGPEYTVHKLLSPVHCIKFTMSVKFLFVFPSLRNRHGTGLFVPRRRRTYFCVGITDNFNISKDASVFGGAAALSNSQMCQHIDKCSENYVQVCVLTAD